MEIYIIYVEGRFLFASPNREDAENIRNYINHKMVEKRDSCYVSIMANIESIPYGTYEDYLNQDKILKDIIFSRTGELEQLKRKLKQLEK